MKKLGEVCKIVGVTRRTLQEYDKMGLLSPTARNKAGHWMYDDAAIQTLMRIRVLVEAGYKRKQIKELLHGPTSELGKEMDKVVEVLEKRRRRVEEYLDYVKGL